MLNKIRKPTIALIDDHSIVRKAVASLVEAFNEFNVVFDVENFDDLKQMLKTNRNLSLLLMDIRMPDKSGFEIASWMKENFPMIKVLALSSESDGFSIAKVMRSGAKGFVSKSASPAELLLAIRTVLGGDAYLNQNDFNAFSNAIQNSNDYFSQNKVEFNPKEIEFIKWACTGLSYNDIADKMFMSTNSIGDYRSAVFTKIGVHTRQELAVYAAKNHFL